MKFETLGLRPELIEGLQKQGIKEVIGIQDKMFTGILTGDNIIACAQTGERVIIVTGCINVLVSRVSGTLTKYNSCIA